MKDKIIIAYKLFRIRKDGSLGSLFINKKDILKQGIWLKSELYPTKGFSIRKGWHALLKPEAPHLSLNNRQWYKVKVKCFTEFERPKSQGGKWVLADEMMILEKYVL